MTEGRERIVYFNYAIDTSSGQRSLYAHVGKRERDRIVFAKAIKIELAAQHAVFSGASLTIDSKDTHARLLLAYCGPYLDEANSHYADSLRVLSIGRHLLYESTATVRTETPRLVRSPSILHHFTSNTLTLVAIDQEQSVPFFQRKRPDGTWARIPLRTTQPFPAANFATFLPTPAGDYVHFATATERAGEITYLSVYQMRGDNFKDLATDDSLLWTHQEIRTRFWDATRFAPVLVPHNEGFCFYFIGRRSWSDLAWYCVNLRPDGSMMEDEDEADEQDEPPGLSFSHLDFEGDMLGAHAVLCDSGEVLVFSMGTKAKVCAHISQPDSDGELRPENRYDNGNWRKLQLEFTTPLLDGSQAGSAVNVVDESMI